MAESGFFGRAVRRFFRDYLEGLGDRSAFGRLVQRAMTDSAARRQLLAAPRQALADAGVRLPEGLGVEVLENTDRVIHLVLPPLVESERSGGEAR